MNTLLALKASSRPCSDAPSVPTTIFPENRSNQLSSQKAYMDECEQQILHEYRHDAAKRAFEMTFSSSTPSSNFEEPVSPSAAPKAQHDSSYSFVSSPLQSHNAPTSPMEALQSCLLSGAYSDLTIIHTSRSWRAHKLVVCSQSPILSTQILALKDTSTLDLSTYDHHAVCLAMEYLYTSSYTTSLDNPLHAPAFSLPMHIKVFVLASAFQIPGLQNLAIQNFNYTLKTHVSELSVYFEAVREIYANTPSLDQDNGLRQAVVECAVVEMGNLLGEERFLELASEVRGFQADIYALLLQKATRPVDGGGQELCEDCGPRDEDEGYEVTMECKVCGKERTIEFY